MTDSKNNVYKLTDHLFRHEAGKMVAVLTRIFGLRNLNLAEDVVQDAFGKALNAWPAKIPENPSAWLMQTAKNKAIDIVRKNRYQQQFAEEGSALLESEYTTVPVIENFFLDNEVQDSRLRMIFTCCHPSLQEADQIALTLKTCSSFSIPEIEKLIQSHHLFPATLGELHCQLNNKEKAKGFFEKALQLHIHLLRRSYRKRNWICCESSYRTKTFP